ncbi:MAG: hypothetical protein AAFZ15_17540 [Bacteroidota bacterium]
MKKIFTLVLLLTLICCSVFAQRDTYYSRNASLTMYGHMGHEIIKLQSRQLNVMLDYESACIMIRLPLNTLVSGVDSLNNLLKTSHGEIVFDGKLGLDYISLENHPPLKFGFEGFLSANDCQTLVRGEGELNHIGDRTGYASMLGLCINLSFDDLGMPAPWPTMGNEFEVVITQALLMRDKN